MKQRLPHAAALLLAAVWDHHVNRNADHIYLQRGVFLLSYSSCPFSSLAGSAVWVDEN